MIAWLRRFFTDDAFFVAALRGMVGLAGALVASGIIPSTGNGWKVGLFLNAMAHFIPAGQQNAKRDHTP